MEETDVDLLKGKDHVEAGLSTAAGGERLGQQGQVDGARLCQLSLLSFLLFALFSAAVW